MRVKLLILSIAVLCLSAAPAIALIGPPPAINDNGTPLDPTDDYVALQNVLDGITTAPVAGSSSVNVLTDYLADTADSIWHIAGSGASSNTMIIELASFAPDNTFGVYDLSNPANTAQIFAGSNVAGDQALLSIAADGKVYVNGSLQTTIAGTWFGYYLDSSLMTNPLDPQGPLIPNPNGGTFYSDSTLNTDNPAPGNQIYDHFLAYQGLGIDTVQIPPWGPGTWTPGEYVLAWEDLRGPVSDWDFTDMVVMVQSVYVPVPAAVLLGVLGLGVVGLKLRKYA